jgi:hypothetical protein
VPTPSKEEEKSLDGNKEKGTTDTGSLNGKEKLFISEPEKELIKKFFQQHSIKKISLKNGELIITHNNNNNNNETISAQEANNQQELQLAKDIVKKSNNQELTAEELEKMASTNSNQPPTAPKVVMAL